MTVKKVGPKPRIRSPRDHARQADWARDATVHSLLNRLARVIRERRIALDITQMDAAKGAGFTGHNAWSQIEAGKSRPSLDKLVACAGILQMRPSELFARAELLYSAEAMKKAEQKRVERAKGAA